MILTDTAIGTENADFQAFEDKHYSSLFSFSLPAWLFLSLFEEAKTMTVGNSDICIPKSEMEVIS
jgi:hypothetical protein